MYQSTSATTSNLPYSNGHLSPLPTKIVTNGAISPSSESDLSEAIDIPNESASYPSNGSNDAGRDNQIHDLEGDTFFDEDALGSDDPDYNMATPPPPGNSSSARDTRSSSQDSPQQRKRKNGAEPDDYILNDPELYGLRRSVSQCDPLIDLGLT